MSSIRQIIYVSTALPKFTDEQLDDILFAARVANAMRDVTGLLVYADGSILQVIEGPSEAVGDLFERVARDPRHSDVMSIADLTSRTRDFGDSPMAHARASRPDSIGSAIGPGGPEISLDRQLKVLSPVGSVVADFIGHGPRFA